MKDLNLEGYNGMHDKQFIHEKIVRDACDLYNTVKMLNIGIC